MLKSSGFSKSAKRKPTLGEPKVSADITRRELAISGVSRSHLIKRDKILLPNFPDAPVITILWSDITYLLVFAGIILTFID